MKLYIFQDIQQVSDSYHPGGGLVIVARDKWHIRKLIKERHEQALAMAEMKYDEKEKTYGPDWPMIQSADIKISKDEWRRVEIYPMPDDAKPIIRTFPNAGCC